MSPTGKGLEAGKEEKENGPNLGANVKSEVFVI